MSAASPVESTTRTQFARRAIWIMLAGIVAYDAYSWYLAVTTQAWQLFAVAGVVLAFGLADGVGLVLARRGRSGQGLWLTVAAFLLTDVVIGALVSGLGLALGLIAPLLTAAMLARSVPSRQLRTGIL